MLSTTAAAALLLACASTPSADMAAAAPAAGSAAPAVAAADGAKKNPFPGTTMRDGPDGSTVYCRKEIPTGERIPKEICYSEYAMKSLEQSKRDDMERQRERSAHTTLSGG